MPRQPRRDRKKREGKGGEEEEEEEREWAYIQIPPLLSREESHFEISLDIMDEVELAGRANIKKQRRR
jgi:hypothetical protein